MEPEPPSGSATPRPAIKPAARPIERSIPRTGPAPELVGLGCLEAHALAAAAHVRLTVSVWVTDTGPWGRVLDQRPSPGALLKRGARIAVIVSGRPYEEVPDVRGLPLDDAIERLTWLGLVPLADVRRPPRALPDAHIASTRPPAGSVLSSGSVVALMRAAEPRTQGLRGASGRADAADSVTRR
jgi:beta-lactam-binding protein with PASTA domain